MDSQGALAIRAEAVEWREIDGEIIVLLLETSHFISLNRSASVLWQLLSEGADVERLVTRLMSEFGISRPIALEDAVSFLNELEARGLLKDLS